MADVIITPITNEDLTTKVVDGTGIFDELMTAANAHLDSQFKNERITGTQYAEVYLGQLQAVLANAVQFLIERDKTYLNNLLINAQIELANKQVELAEKQLEQADKQLELLEKQIELQQAQSDLARQKIKTEIAQIADTVDGVAVGGVIGAQVALYKQQRESFLRDAEQKSLKILADTWITRKTIDDGVEVPVNFDTDALNAFTQKVADGIGVTI
ncbi:virion structural protein [Salmonella phage vB_SalP_TR2]|jgi:hypothetical protein|uniref:Uncharacterized protein n=1 Tax=Salmonella phage vB_SalP_TR2 TaxID=2812854 RepID=A0A898KA67_9CAUD|nr:virion structural protein [Salmonella phage vB_SalP_TR2]QSJ04056.1 hypothetical protein [Salmonella phage vB_SalP_TR2]DAV70412.1 MAG TPA: hypothetical protein [Caudoviricetes sp.]